MNVEQGPLLEQGMATAGLDYYKPTMSQLAYEKERDAEVTFTFKNRSTEQRIMDHVSVETLQDRFDYIRQTGFQEAEINHLANQVNADGERVFSDNYLTYLKNGIFPEVTVRHDEETDDIAIETTGDFPLVTFWETIVMSEVNEAYFEGYVLDNGLDLAEIYDEGDRRLSEKIKILQENPDIQFADFGTRRHFSLRWQRHVLQRLQAECPQNLIGTSNVALANTQNMAPIGTFAHEMPMVYAGLADSRGKNIRASHNTFLRDWENVYGTELTIALTDTFGTAFFFEDFTREQAKTWKGLRHDSGDPIEFAERAIAFYENYDIDPTEKTIVFSDGLDIDTILKLHGMFKDRVNVVFGWGTTLTNDLGITPLSIVMKATMVNGAETAKLSDDEGKHTGRLENVKRYKKIFAIKKLVRNVFKTQTAHKPNLGIKEVDPTLPFMNA